jgi:hypothetical protein
MKISLFEAMCIRNEYTAEQCSAEIRTMCRAIDNGADPEELLHEQGIEADMGIYAQGLLDYYSDYMDEQEQRLED